MKKLLLIAGIIFCLSPFARAEVVASVTDVPTILVPDVGRIGNPCHFVTIINTGDEMIFFRANRGDVDVLFDIPIPPGAIYSGYVYGRDGTTYKIKQIAIATDTGGASSCVVGFQ